MAFTNVGSLSEQCTWSLYLQDLLRPVPVLNAMQRVVFDSREADLFNNNVPLKNVYHLRGPASYHLRALVLQGPCRTYAMGCMNRRVAMLGY